MKTTLTLLFNSVIRSKAIFEKYIIKTFEIYQLNKHFVAIFFSSLILINSTNIFSQVIAGGTDHSLFLCNNGTPMATGGNGSGQLGDGTTINKYTPIQIGSLSNVVSVSAGFFHSLFLKNDGSVWACGQNFYGQLGDGTNADKNNPVQITYLSGIKYIASGAYHSLFLKGDSTVWACGHNLNGQLGDGSLMDKSVPVKINSLSGIVKIAAGFGHSLFLKSDGTVWACGSNFYGQLGDGTTIDKSTPVQIPSLSGVVDIAAGDEHSFFLKNNGTVWACGRNNEGQLGDGTTTDKSTPVQISSLTGIVAIAAGYNHSLFLKNNGTVWACGDVSYGKTGIVPNSGSITTPTQINSFLLSGITAIAAGYDHSIFLKNDGTVWACGRNDQGQLGDGTNYDKYTPGQVTGLCIVTSFDNKNVLSENNISLYPNPFSTQTTLSSDKYLNNATINIYNAFGQIVKQINNLSGHTFTLSNDNLPAGFYFLHLIEKDKIIKTEKLVVSE
jgi:alpha-tubulin suppressor-like RCC1 family protein